MGKDHSRGRDQDQLTHYDEERCQALVRECFESADYQEGRKAFMEKRKPQFKGR